MSKKKRIESFDELVTLSAGAVLMDGSHHVFMVVESADLTYSSMQFRCQCGDDLDAFTLWGEKEEYLEIVLHGGH